MEKFWKRLFIATPLCFSRKTALFFEFLKLKQARPGFALLATRQSFADVCNQSAIARPRRPALEFGLRLMPRPALVYIAQLELPVKRTSS